MVLRVVRWEEGIALPGLSSSSWLDNNAKASGPKAQTVTVKVNGDQQATVGDLQTAIACSALRIPISFQRLIKFRENGSAVVLADGKAELVKDYAIWSGEDVVVEVSCCCLGCIVFLWRFLSKLFACLPFPCHSGHGVRR